MPDLCYGCMKESSGDSICPHCGFDKNTQQKAPFLSLGKKLQDRYIVGKTLFNRADSVTYIGYDDKQSKVINIIEFLPAGLCTRRLEDDSLIPNEDADSVYSSYCEEFRDIYVKIKENSNLGAITTILDVFNDNNTIYAIEEVDDTIPFEEYIERSSGDSMEWSMARPLFMPLLSALSKINQDGLFHLGVSPDNLVVTSSGKIKLINFAIKEVRQKGHKLADVLYSGCSAPEQYSSDGVVNEQTEIYGFTATLFYALSGRLPADAMKRKEDGRLLISTNVVKKLPPHVVTALANGLQVDKRRRVLDFETLRAQLSAAPTVKAIQEEIARPAVVPVVDDDTEKKKGISNFAWGIIAAVISLIVFSTVGFFWISTNPFDGMFNSDDATEPASDISATEPQGEDFTYPRDSEFFRVPSFIGLKFEDVQKKAEDSDDEFKVVRTTEDVFSDAVAEGFVCEQYPEGRTTVDRGKGGVAIAVKVSKGSKSRTLPKVDNLSYDNALKLLSNQHLLTNVVLKSSDRVPADTVISYKDYKEGDKVDYGSTVTIVVSSGPELDSRSKKNTGTNEFVHSDTLSMVDN